MGELVVMPALGGASRRVAKINTGDGVPPVWSPDSSVIVLAGYRGANVESFALRNPTV